MKNTPHEEPPVMSPTHNEKSPKGEALPSSDMVQPLKKVKPLRRVTCSQTLISTTIRSSLGREDSSASLSQMEHDTAKHQNGWPHICSQRSVEEKLQLATVGDGDKHLVEFSDALRTVTKALREVAESKARASNEAAAWKLKYEMERLRTFHLEQTHQEHCQSSPDFWSPGEVIELKEKEPDTGEPIFEACLFKCDSWSPSEPPEVDKENDNGEQSSIGSPTGRLSPQGNMDCCKNGGICTQQVLRSHSSSAANMTDLSDTVNRQEKAPFRLAWGCVGEKTGRHKHDVVSFESGNITTANRSSKQITLVWDSPPQSVFILSKPNSPTVETLCMEMVRWLREKGIGVYVEPTVKQELLKDDSYFSFVQTCETENEGICLHTKVDLVITLGGDGTVLWAAQMFKGPVPPVVSFSMGSLGFMTPFLAESDQYKECLQNIMKGPVYITLRHRLHCQIVRNPENVKEGEEHSLPEDHLVLNEVSIDRGMSSFLTDLECYCDNLFVTSVQGDGLILSTPSGSTAYSLAAGGSMVHPQVPGILFTPICPHSLSFRPLILPEYVKVRVQVPINSRGQAWASFDGKDRQQLSGGDALICQLSAWPVPAACDKESTTEFLRSVREGLHWNLRKSQLSDGPHNSN